MARNDLFTSVFDNIVTRSSVPKGGGYGKE